MPEFLQGDATTAARWQAVLAVVEPALELPTAERAAFVRRACGDDAALRVEVESLLAADEEAGDFLEVPADVPGRLARPDALFARLQAALGAEYRVVRELGGGGMSRVFVAEETRLGRRVAVKVLPPEIGVALGAERFHREARLIASLQHPHIVPLLAAGEGADGLLYYTMPYVEGESLARRLEREGPLALGAVVAVVREVAGALDHAHARGIVHRDVKPANVLTDGTHVLVADFGIARAAPVAEREAPGSRPATSDAPSAAPGMTLTGAGLVLGTPAYMSPEQADGGHVDARSDVYSLGCLTFELLTGRRPFADGFPAATALRPELPAAIDAVLARALARRPDDRFQGALDFADALAAADAAPARELGAPRARGGRRWATRRVAAALAVTVVAAAGAATVVRRVVAPAARAPSAAPTAPTAAADRRRTLAVLPFENVGPSGDAYFADGVADELASRLTSLAGLRVISPRSTREYRGTAKPPTRIGAELGADYLLQGRVRWERAGDGGPDAGVGRVRVTAELVSARDGSAVWADRYAAAVRDVIDVEGEIGERVAAALELALGDGARQALAARPTANFDAYSDFLRGEALRVAPSGPSGAWQGAVTRYERAVARDPRFALAYARLSEMQSRLYHAEFDAEFDRSEARLTRARAAGETAVRLDPTLAEGHLALGLYYYYGLRQYDRALDEFTRALRAQPGRAEVQQARGYVLRRQGRFADAAASLTRAIELDPRSAAAAWDLAETYAMMRDFPAAMRYYDRATALAPDWAIVYAERARRLVAWRGDTAEARRIVRDGLTRAKPGLVVARLSGGATLLLGDGPAARAAVRGVTVAAFGGDTTRYLVWMAEWARLHGEPARARAYGDSVRRRLEPLVAATPDDRERRLVLARAYAAMGRSADALREGARAVALAPATRDAIDEINFLQDLAQMEVSAGAYDAAVGRLEVLLRMPSDYTATLLRLDPRWAPLRTNARFRRLVDAPQ